MRVICKASCQLILSFCSRSIFDEVNTMDVVIEKIMVRVSRMYFLVLFLNRSLSRKDSKSSVAKYCSSVRRRIFYTQRTKLRFNRLNEQLQLVSSLYLAGVPAAAVTALAAGYMNDDDQTTNEEFD